jgi:hypothetical protein
MFVCFIGSIQAEELAQTEMSSTAATPLAPTLTETLAIPTVAMTIVPPPAIPTGTPTQAPMASATPTQTALPVLVNTATAIESNTYSPSPTPSESVTRAQTVETPTETSTPTATPSIPFQAQVKTGMRRCHSPDQARLLIKTLIAEKSLSAVKDGRSELVEKWRIVYRAPDDFLLEVFDAHGRLERRKYICGLTSTILAGNYRQQISNPKALAWSKVVQCLDWGMRAEECTSFREILPQVWMPNGTQSNPIGKGAGMAASITSLIIDSNVDSVFSAGDH